MARPGVFFTPPELARDLASALSGRPPVLDPACGEGELLLAALEAAGNDPHYAAEGLYGIEIDPELARRTRRRLLEAVEPEARRGLEAALETHIRCADALDPARPWPPGTQVLANPPWVSLSGRQARRLSADQRARERDRRPLERGWPSLHGAFLDRIARHVAKEGTGARVLLPAGVCGADRYGPLRETVSATCRLDPPPSELGEGVFEGVSEETVLLGLSPRPRPGRGSPAPWIRRTSEEAALLESLGSFPRLPPESFGDPGVHTGNCAAELVERSAREGLPGLREGRDLAPFRLAPPAAGLRLDVERGPGRRFRIGPLERYTAVRVLLRQTADRPLAALHEEPTYFRNSLLACRPPEGLAAEFVVAVLNGPVAALWHRLSFREGRQRTFPQVKVGHLRTQPFPIAHRDEYPALHDRLASFGRGCAPERQEEYERCLLEAFDGAQLAPREW